MKKDGWKSLLTHHEVWVSFVVVCVCIWCMQSLKPTGISHVDTAFDVLSILSVICIFFAFVDTIIGADTIVVVNGEILGKPRDESDAKRMLRLLSGTEHSVFTGACIICRNENNAFCDETKVRFFELTEREIDAYVASGEPFDKAGGYGIQDTGALLVSGIDGDYYNVMGLPVGRLYRELLKAGLLK